MIQKFFLTLLALGFLFLIVQSVQAQCPAPGEGLVPCGTDGCPCTLCHFFSMFKRIIDFIMIPLVPIIAVLMLVIGGLMFFFSAGSPGNLAKAKSVITSTVLGLMIVYVAWIMVNTFFVIIGVAEWTGLLPSPGGSGWFVIDCGP